MPAVSNIPAVSLTSGEMDPPPTVMPSPSPAPVILSDELRALGQTLSGRFNTYKANRVVAETRWLKAQRQMIGLYDPEVETNLAENRSRAYPRITRVKVFQVLAKIMDLMFPGNEENWDLKPSPDPDLPRKRSMRRSTPTSRSSRKPVCRQSSMARRSAPRSLSMRKSLPVN